MADFGQNRLWPKPTLGPPGLHTTTKELQRRTFELPGGSKTPPKFHEKTPKEREEKKTNYEAGEGKKSAKFWAPHPSGPYFFWFRALHEKKRKEKTRTNNPKKNKQLKNTKNNFKKLQTINNKNPNN